MGMSNEQLTPPKMMHDSHVSAFGSPHRPLPKAQGSPRILPSWFPYHPIRGISGRFQSDVPVHELL